MSCDGYEPSREINLCQREEGLAAIEVRPEGEAVRATHAQLIEVFQSSKAKISKHIGKSWRRARSTRR